MTLEGMYRIAAKDADALGEDSAETTKREDHSDQTPADAEQIKENLKTVFDPEIPVNVVDLGLIYRVEIEGVADRGKDRLRGSHPYRPGLRNGAGHCRGRQRQGSRASWNRRRGG